MGKGPISYFETGADCWTLQGNDVRGASCMVRLNIEKAMEIRRLSRLTFAL